MDTRFREDVGSAQNCYLGQFRNEMYYDNGTKSTISQLDFNADYHPPIRRCWDELHPGPPFRSGGPFRSVKGDDGSKQISKIMTISSHNLSDPPKNTYVYSYTGAFQPRLGSLGLDYTNFSQIGLSGAYGPTYMDPSEYGAQAWRRFAPKLEFAQLGVAVAEMRDLPRMLRQTAKTFKNVWKSIGGKGSTLFDRREIGRNFLNQQFGWAPFISDIRKTISVTRNFHLHYSQIKRDNGNWIRRSGTYQQSHSVDSFSQTNFGATDDYLYPCAYFPAAMFDGPYRGTAVKRVISEEKITFSGKFRYWIPSFESDDSHLLYMRNALQLYGLHISPSLLWEAMPWSWLIDWWSNAGDVISNLSQSLQYGLGAQYAYIMRNVRKSYKLSVTPYFKYGDNGPIYAEGFISSKRREAAHPWGFDLEWGELSPTQIAILTALGLANS